MILGPDQRVYGRVITIGWAKGNGDERANLFSSKSRNLVGSPSTLLSVQNFMTKFASEGLKVRVA